VNRRGYLVDRKGNIKTRKGQKLFNKDELDETGEIPKLFKFTIFDQQGVSGTFQFNDDGSPILKSRETLPKGIFLDDVGNRVTKHGYLVDLEGNIIDKKGNKVFDKKIVIDGNVPQVFTKIKGPNREKRE